MFYDMVFRQLNLSDDVPLRILDFGAGFCVAANHYAGHHKVTAVEPDEKMWELPFELISGDIETLNRYEEDAFADQIEDAVTCALQDVVPEVLSESLSYFEVAVENSWKTLKKEASIMLRNNICDMRISQIDRIFCDKAGRNNRCGKFFAQSFWNCRFSDCPSFPWRLF